MASLLIVDDDDDVRELLAEFLSNQGHHVRTACDGEEGLRRLGEAIPDAILLDVEMPKLDGPGMAYRMLVHDAGLELVPIVLFSGGIDLPRVAQEIGTPYQLAKPADPGRVAETLRRALDERAPPMGPRLG